MDFTLRTLLVAFGLFSGMMLAMEAGRRMGARRLRGDPDGASAGIGPVEGGVFGLLGLLLAFNFSGAASRFDSRRQLIVEEANAIGTAYLRLDLLAPPARERLQETFRRYLDTRLETYRKIPDLAAVSALLSKGGEMQNDIWRQAVGACRAEANQAATIVLLPAINAMIDITTTRTMAARMHPPAVIFGMMIALSLVASLLAGYGMGANKLRSWVHVVGFSLSMATAIYVIVDLEFPRLGLLRVDTFDQALVDTRASMR